MGFVTTFLLVIVVLPIAAIIWKSTGNGWSGFWDVVSSPQAVAAFKLTLVVSTLAVLTTAVFGTIRLGDITVRDAPNVPASKQQCKNGDWHNFPDFKNEGQCVSFVATGGKKQP